MAGSMKTTYRCDGRPRILVDFDGVIGEGGHFVASEVFDMPPVPGAMHWLEEISHEFEVLIFTARMCMEEHVDHDNSGKSIVEIAAAMSEWFARQGLPEHVIDKLVLYPPELGKPSVHLMIDDHGYRFDGAYPNAEAIHLMYRGMYWKDEDYGA